jgi:hypothetical protein
MIILFAAGEHPRVVVTERPFQGRALLHGTGSDLAEIDLDEEGHGQFHDAGEDFAVAVAAGRRVENVRVNDRCTSRGLLNTPIELNTSPRVLIQP